MKALFKPFGIALFAIALLAGCNNKPTKIGNDNDVNNNENNTTVNNTATANGVPTEWSGSIDANVTWPDLGLDVDYIIERIE